MSPYGTPGSWSGKASSPKEVCCAGRPAWRRFGRCVCGVCCLLCVVFGAAVSSSLSLCLSLSPPFVCLCLSVSVRCRCVCRCFGVLCGAVRCVAAVPGMVYSCGVSELQRCFLVGLRRMHLPMHTRVSVCVSFACLWTRRHTVERFWGVDVAAQTCGKLFLFLSLLFRLLRIPVSLFFFPAAVVVHPAPLSPCPPLLSQATL